MPMLTPSTAEQEHRSDPVVVAARRREVAKLLAHTDERRAWLADLIASGRADSKAAAQWKQTVPSIGVLDDYWDEFIALPQAQQLDALQSKDFRGMPWQSLLQCCPYFEA